MDYPLEFDELETIVRVAKTPYHFNKSGLKPAAFRPPKGSDEISVIRWRYVNPDGPAMKAKVREIASAGGAEYRGLAHLTAAACSAAGVELRDSRVVFQGHADLVFPVSIPGDGEPASATDHQRIVAITEALQKACTVLLDPEPESEQWTLIALPVPSGKS